MFKIASALKAAACRGSASSPARTAHESADVEASRKWHQQKSTATEKHSEAGSRVKNLLFGGLDGIITTFAVVAGAAGGGLDIEVILILGFSSVFADALSMGIGDALSTKAENEFIMRERAREKWEMENYPQGEVQEMIEIFTRRGMSKEDATSVIETMAKYKDFFVDIMMTEELGLQVPDADDSPVLDGLVTGTSFVVFGTVPLLGYVALYSIGLTAQEQFNIACILTAVTLFILGAVKTKFTSQRWWRGGLEILTMGSFTATAAYAIGWFIEAVVLDGASAGDSGGLH